MEIDNDLRGSLSNPGTFPNTSIFDVEQHNKRVYSRDLAVERTAPTKPEEVWNMRVGGHASIEGLEKALRPLGFEIIYNPPNDGYCVRRSVAVFHSCSFEDTLEVFGKNRNPKVRDFKQFLLSGRFATPTVHFGYTKGKWGWTLLDTTQWHGLVDLDFDGAEILGIVSAVQYGNRRTSDMAHCVVIRKSKGKEKGDIFAGLTDVPSSSASHTVSKQCANVSTVQLVKPLNVPVKDIDKLSEVSFKSKDSIKEDSFEIVNGEKVPSSIVYALRCRTAGMVIDEWSIASVREETKRLFLELKTKVPHGIQRKIWAAQTDALVDEQLRAQPQRELFVRAISTRRWLKLQPCVWRSWISTLDHINYYNRVHTEHWNYVQPKFIGFAAVMFGIWITKQYPKVLTWTLWTTLRWLPTLVCRATFVFGAYCLYNKLLTWVCMSREDSIRVGGCDCHTKSIAVDCSLCRVIGPNCRCGRPKWNFKDRFCSVCSQPANPLVPHVVANEVCEISSSKVILPLPRCVTFSVDPIPPIKQMRKDAKLEMYKPARQCQRSNRRGLHLVGWATARAMPLRTQVTVRAMETALKCRALAEVPQPSATEWHFLRKFWDEAEPVVFGELPDLKAIKYDLWNKRFPARRQRQHDEGRSLLTIQGGIIHPRQFRTKAFVKVEKLLKGARFGPESYAPRPIQGFEEIVNVCLGPFMYGLTLWLKRRLKARVVYASGMNSEQMGKVFHAIPDSHIWMMDDFSQYDSTEGEECFKFFYDFCSRLGIGKYPMAAKCLKQQFETQGTTRQGHRYSVPYTMKSGAANTSCQNSLMNIVSHLYCIHKQNRYMPIVELLDKVHVVVNGDDNVLAVDPSLNLSLSELKQDMSMLGFVAKPFPCNKHTFTFCGMRPWPVVGGIVMGPDFERHVPKLGWALDKPEDPDAWLSGVLNGYWDTSQHVPFLRHVIRRLKVLYPGEHRSSLGSVKDHMFKIQKGYMTCDETWVMCQEVYGVTKEMEEQFGRDLDRVWEPTGMLVHPALRVLIPGPIATAP